MIRIGRTAFLLLIVPTILWSQSALLSRIRGLEEAGKFSEAASVIREGAAADRTLTDTLSFENERLDRIRFDYSLTEERLFGQIQRSIAGVTREEFLRWIGEGKFDRRNIDGETRYLNVSRSNLFWRYPEIAARRINPPNDSAFDRGIWKNCVEIMKAALAEGAPYVLPKTFRITMTLTLDSGAVPAGTKLRTWLPIPRSYPFQRKFEIVRTDPAVMTVGASDDPIRSAYFEQNAPAGSTKFQIEYDYTADGVWFNTDAAAVTPYDPSDPGYRQFTSEAPHIVFSDTMRALAASIAGAEMNPLVRARLFYNWIAGHIQYSYAHEYTTLRNLGEYCLLKRYGDCGQEALLYMTLCRLSGIPARWQSGWFTFPGGRTNHDWCEIFIPPYGWMPVDPYMGIFAMQYLKTLGPVQQRAVRDFYFCGLDQYRMAANGDHCQVLTPAKKYFRSDIVDFQRGEIESEGRNLYFDVWGCDLQMQER